MHAPKNSIATGPSWSVAAWPGVVTLLLLAYCLWQVIAVDVVVWTTNDSSTYLSHGSDLSRSGVIVAGYRTVGYPLFLRAVHEISAILPIDGLFGAVLLQRLLLAGGLVASVFILRIWALPVVAFVASPMMMSFTNLIGPEPLMLSLMLIFSLGCVVLYRRALAPGPSVGYFGTYGLLCLLFIYVCTLKVSMAPFGLLLAAILWRVSATASPAYTGPPLLVWFAPSVRLASLALAVTCVALIAFLGLAALENRAEFGVTSPATNMERSRYWGVYTLVFSDPLNRKKPELQLYYDSGSPYPFLHKMECAGEFKTPTCVATPYSDRRLQIEDRIAQMLNAAGVTPALFQATGTAAVFWGGRLDDIGPLVRKVLGTVSPVGAPTPTALIDNLQVRAIGLEAFLVAYNSGSIPGKVDGIGFPTWLGYHPKTIQPWLSAFAFSCLLATLLSRGWRVFGLAGFAAFTIFAMALGLAYLDDWRYIVPSWVAVVVVAMGAVSSTAEGLKRNGGGQMTDRLRSL